MQRLSFLRNLHSSLIIISTRFVHSVNWQFLSEGGGGRGGVGGGEYAKGEWGRDSN